MYEKKALRRIATVTDEKCQCPYCGTSFHVGIASPGRLKYGTWVCYNGKQHTYIHDTVVGVNINDWNKGIFFDVVESSPLTILAQRFKNNEDSTS